MVHRITTKELLGESLRELANRRSLDKITVKEIAQNCGITSATFYNHFKDKYELIAWILNRQMEEIYSGYAEGNNSWKQTIINMVNVIYHDRVFYKNAFANTSGQNSFIVSTHSHSIGLLIDIVRERAGSNFNEELTFFVEFYLRATSVTIMEWILAGCDIPPACLAEYFYQAIPAALQPYLI